MRETNPIKNRIIGRVHMLLNALDAMCFWETGGFI